MALFIVHKGRQISNEKLSLSTSGFKHILSRYFFGETLSDGKLQQHFSFGIEYFHLKYVLLLLNHHYRCTFHAITATDNHREVIAKAAFGMIGIFMCVRVKADIERCFLQKFTPKPGTQILVVVSVKRNVMNQNPLSGFLKFFGRELTLQKSYLVITQLRKIVESVVYPMIIRLIFTAIEHYDTGISPVEGAVSLIAYIIEQAVQAYRIGIPDLVIAAHKEDRYAVTLHAFGQFADKGCCLIVIGGVVYTIAVEHYKIIVNPLYLFAQCLKRLRLFMQVVEHHSRKTVITGCGQRELPEFCTGCIAKHLL